MSHLFQFEDVCYWYKNDHKDLHILNKVNVYFEKGYFYTIVGPSGSGKTTFLSITGSTIKSKKEYELEMLKKLE